MRKEGFGMFTKRVDSEGLSLVFIENHGKAGGEEGWGELAGSDSALDVSN